jgi:hypothetical protein
LKDIKQKMCHLDGKKNSRKEPFYNLHDLCNLKIVPHTPARRENCRGVGQYPSQDCPCVRVVDLHAKRKDKEEHQNEHRYNEEEPKEYLSKIMAAPKKDYKVCKYNHDPCKSDCCKDGTRKTWLEHPPEDYSTSSIKQISEQFMKTQQQIPRTIKEANYNQEMNSPWKDPKLVDVYGHLLNSTNSKYNGIPNDLNQVCNKDYNHINSQKTIPRLSHTTKVFQQIALEKKSYFEQPLCSRCPTKSLSFSNKKCKWGGCHGPIKTRCLNDPKKEHMFMNEYQVWHCGGCCKMERDHVAYESMQLLQQSDIALEKKYQKQQGE